MSTATSHLAVMRNPFSTAAASARIPDGSATLSSSSRLSHSVRVNATSETVLVALYPGFSTHLYIIGTGVGSAGVNLDADSLAPDLGISSRTVTTSGANDTLTIVSNQNAPCKYRVVSQGMRISLIENSENNDGWFEAIRVPAAYDANDFVTVPSNLGSGQKIISPYNNGSIFGGNLGLVAVSTHRNWAMNPTYITGKLRDINRHTFMLHRENDYDFVDIGNQNNVVAVGTTAEYGDNRIIRSAGSRAWWCDPNMDTVLIRMHSSASGSSAGQNLHIHTVQHVEEQFEPDSELARYMTKPPSSPAMTAAVMNAIRRMIKPSIIRAPTGAVGLKFDRTPRTYRRTKSLRRRAPVRRTRRRLTKSFKCS